MTGRTCLTRHGWFSCGNSLARAHARSGDSIAISAYLGGGNALGRAIAEFSHAYADQNERDHAAFAARLAANAS